MHLYHFCSLLVIYMYKLFLKVIYPFTLIYNPPAALYYGAVLQRKNSSNTNEEGFSDPINPSNCVIPGEKSANYTQSTTFLFL